MASDWRLRAEYDHTTQRVRVAIVADDVDHFTEDGRIARGQVAFPVADLDARADFVPTGPYETVDRMGLEAHVLQRALRRVLGEAEITSDPQTP